MNIKQKRNNSADALAPPTGYTLRGVTNDDAEAVTAMLNLLPISVQSG